MRLPAVACLFSLRSVRALSKKVCTLFLDGVMSNFPPYLRRCCPEKVHPLVDVRNEGLVWGKGEPS